MRLLDRYIGKHVITSTFLVVLILVGIQSFMDFVSQLSDIGKGHYGVLQALFYVPLRLPTDLYQLFPVAGFLGSLIGLGRLASGSQLIVMRAAGFSILQIVGAVVKAAILMLIVITALGEWVAPLGQDRAVQLKIHALHKQLDGNALEGVWLHQGNAYINIRSVSYDEKLTQVTSFVFGKNHQLSTLIFAPSGYRDRNGWVLQDVQETQLLSDKVTLVNRKSQRIPLVFEPKLLKKTQEDVDAESLFTLVHNILYREKTGLVTSQYEYAFWKRLFQPLTTLVMICLGIPFVFGSLRSSTMGFRIMMGVIVGFGFNMLNQFFGPITLVYQFPPLFAAAMPTVLFSIAYVMLFKRIT